MKIGSTKPTASRLKKYGLALALGVVIVASSTSPVLADGHDRDWDHHAAYAHRDWHRWHGHPQPGYVYAPPVVYAPPPQSPGINLIVPFNIR